METRGILKRRASLALAIGAIALLGSTGSARAQCTADEQCEDGDFCSQNTCFIPGPSGQCIETEYPCSDGVYCNGNELCSESRDLCEVACVGGTVCDSGFCVCNDGGGCPGGNIGAPCNILVQPVNCSPGLMCNESLDACTECFMNSHCTAPEGRCNTATGECVECLTSSHCFDSLFCNGQESCNTSTGECEPGQNVQCPLGEFCSEAFDECVECEDNADCDDGVHCNGEETCNKSTRECVAGTPVNCQICIGGTNNGNNCAVQSDCPGGGACRTYFCNEASDSCVQCRTDIHTDCSDIDYCTRNLCIENACVFVHDNSVCSDGQFCNGEEVCVGSINNPACNNITGAGCCRSACLGGGTCNTSTHLCVGGSNPNAPCEASVQPPATDDGLACTIDSCNETQNVVVHTPSDAVCNDNLFCNGVETCNPSGQGSDINGCVAGTAVGCSALETSCRNASCSESQDKCVTSPLNDVLCEDDDPCTATSACSSAARTCSNSDDFPCTTDGQCPARGGICSNVDLPCTPSSGCPAGGTCGGAGTCVPGVCQDDPPASNDPYRCVRLEWRNVTSSVAVNGIINMDLYAVATGCNVFANPQSCPTTQQEIIGVRAVLNWNETQLQLLPSTPGNLNPEDPCNLSDPCGFCPVNQINWDLSAFDNDCMEDALNEPCSGGTPANDGDARYSALVPVAQGCTVPPACVTTAGTWVTRLKFRALRGGQAHVTIEPCAGQYTRTSVISSVPPPTGYVTSDVIKSIGPQSVTTVTCTSTAECNDFNTCTSETCVGNVCQFTNVTGSCNNGLYCDGPTDTCVNGVCTGPGNPCTNPSQPLCDEPGDRCVACFSAEDCVDTIQVGPAVLPNVCTTDVCNTTTGLCEHTPVNCDDGHDCTVDAPCRVSGSTPVCDRTPDHTVCETGDFCSAQHCDLMLGCTSDHECFSDNGNPCPNNSDCDEDTDTCGGCLSPAVVASGCRHLMVTPANQGTTPVALLVEGDCADGSIACISQYVQSRCSGGPNDGQQCASDADCPRICSGGPTPGAPCTTNGNCTGPGQIGTCVGAGCKRGSLGDQPVFLTAQQWGAVQVSGAGIRPNALYRAMSDCNFPSGRVLSAASEQTTWKWGDTNGDGTVNVLDVSSVVAAVKELWAQATLEGSDLEPCTPNNLVNVLDVAFTVDALKGFVFTCAAVCP